MEPIDRSRDGAQPEARYFESPESSVDRNGDAAQFYATGPIKFVLMFFATIGLYPVYWSYRNWHFIQERDQSGVTPILAALFYPLTFYWFMRSLAPSLDSRVLSSAAWRATLAGVLFVISASSAFPDPYWLVSMLAFVPMMPIVLAMSSTAKRNPSAARRVPAFHWSNAFAYVLVFPLLVLGTASMTGVVPSAEVISGEQMKQSDIAYLREAGILGEDEEIEHFYSTALLSIADDGQFYSSDYVTSYYVMPDTGELNLQYAAYPDIEDIEVDWSASFVDPTVVTITTTSEGSFELWLSNEKDGDRTFVDGMMALWREKRDPT